MSVTRRPVGRRVVEAHHEARALSKSSPLDCLNRSRTVMARLIRPGDGIRMEDGSRVRVAERLLDEDGEVVLVLEDGSYFEVPNA